jgi:hypothetical protein
MKDWADEVGHKPARKIYNYILQKMECKMLISNYIFVTRQYE